MLLWVCFHRQKSSDRINREYVSRRYTLKSQPIGKNRVSYDWCKYVAWLLPLEIVYKYWRILIISNLAEIVYRHLEEITLMLTLAVQMSYKLGLVIVSLGLACLLPSFQSRTFERLRMLCLIWFYTTPLRFPLHFPTTCSIIHISTPPPIQALNI